MNADILAHAHGTLQFCECKGDVSCSSSICQMAQFIVQQAIEDETVGDLIAADADGWITLDDGIQTQNTRRACQFLHAEYTRVNRELNDLATGVRMLIAYPKAREKRLALLSDYIVRIGRQGSILREEAHP